MIDPVEMEVMERPELVEEQKVIDPSAIYLCNLSENDDPEYADPGASGMDLRADLSKFNDIYLYNGCVNTDTSITLYPGGRALIPTGLHMALPLGLEAQVRPRSGLALKYGITVLNAPGTIDSKINKIIL